MKHDFKLPNFPNDHFEMETNVFTGKSKLTQSGVVVEQSKDKGRPFLIKDGNGTITKAFPKNTIDFSLALDINGTKHRVAEKLQWHEYAVGALPILLLFVGGMVGGAFGGGCTVLNFSVFREEGTVLSKYAKVIGINVLCFGVYFLVATFLLGMFKG
jgi:hypothetical protein